MVFPDLTAQIVVLVIFDLMYFVYFCKVTNQIGNQIQASSKQTMTWITYIISLILILKGVAILVNDEVRSSNQRMIVYVIIDQTINLFRRLLILLVYLFFFKLKEIEYALDLQGETPQQIINAMDVMQARIKRATKIIASMDLLFITINATFILLKYFGVDVNEDYH